MFAREAQSRRPTDAVANVGIAGEVVHTHIPSVHHQADRLACAEVAARSG
jgi:hypothetical protein